MRAGSGLRHRLLRVGIAGLVVDHTTVLGEEAAVPVAGELVQAHVRHDHQIIAHRFPAGGDGPLFDAVGCPGLRAPRILVRIIGHPEQHDPAQSRLYRRSCDATDLFDGVPTHPRHGADLGGGLADEDRQNELRRTRPGFADQSSHGGGGA